MERWLRTDKMVLLTVDPSYRHQAYIFKSDRSGRTRQVSPGY
ncbi:hypothetical protein ACFYO1_02735 [Nocardia sp. NPDC006044]